MIFEQNLSNQFISEFKLYIEYIMESTPIPTSMPVSEDYNYELITHVCGAEKITPNLLVEVHKNALSVFSENSLNEEFYLFAGISSIYDNELITSFSFSYPFTNKYVAVAKVTMRDVLFVVWSLAIKKQMSIIDFNAYSSYDSASFDMYNFEGEFVIGPRKFDWIKIDTSNNHTIKFSQETAKFINEGSKNYHLKNFNLRDFEPRPLILKYCFTAQLIHLVRIEDIDKLDYFPSKKDKLTQIFETYGEKEFFDFTLKFRFFEDGEINLSAVSQDEELMKLRLDPTIEWPILSYNIMSNIEYREEEIGMSLCEEFHRLLKNSGCVLEHNAFESKFEYLVTNSGIPRTEEFEEFLNGQDVTESLLDEWNDITHRKFF